MAATTDTAIRLCKKQSPHITVLIPTASWESAGTSMANHLAMASIIEPGDEVLIEHPAYGPILDFVAPTIWKPTSNAFGAYETGSGPSTQTPLRLHHAKYTAHRNYQFAQSNKRAYARVGSAGNWRHRAEHRRRSCCGRSLFGCRLRRNAANIIRSGPEFRTSSLTKIYGVSGLRCGWILAPPDLACKMRKLNDLYSATPVYLGQLLAVAVFKHL